MQAGTTTIFDVFGMTDFILSKPYLYPTYTLPMRNDTETPRKLKALIMALAVALCEGGNQTAEKRAGPEKVTVPATPLNRADSTDILVHITMYIISPLPNRRRTPPTSTPTHTHLSFLLVCGISLTFGQIITEFFPGCPPSLPHHYHNSHFNTWL